MVSPTGYNQNVSSADNWPAKKATQLPILAKVTTVVTSMTTLTPQSPNIVATKQTIGVTQVVTPTSTVYNHTGYKVVKVVAQPTLPTSTQSGDGWHSLRTTSKM